MVGLGGGRAYAGANQATNQSRADDRPANKRTDSNARTGTYGATGDGPLSPSVASGGNHHRERQDKSDSLGLHA